MDHKIRDVPNRKHRLDVYGWGNRQIRLIKYKTTNSRNAILEVIFKEMENFIIFSASFWIRAF